MTAGQLMEKLEALVDAESLSSIVECLGDICGEKADHLRANWQDEHTAKLWEKRMHKLWKWSEELKPL